jgi:Leucine-rich repeat (LRR) protein
VSSDITYLDRQKPVIPRQIPSSLTELHLYCGSLFFDLNNSDTLLLRWLNTPTLEYLSLIGFAPYKDQVDNFFVGNPNLKRLFLGTPSIALLNLALQSQSLRQLELFNFGFFRSDTTLPDDSLDEEALFSHPTIEKMIIHSSDSSRFIYKPKLNRANTVLKELEVRSSTFIAFDSSISKFAALKTLRMRNCKLVSMPKEVALIKTLEVLDLSNTSESSMVIKNAITSIPQEITNLRSTLKKLILTGNPIPTEQRAMIQSLLPNTTIIW